jgi:hypothetical protein
MKLLLLLYVTGKDTSLDSNKTPSKQATQAQGQPSHFHSPICRDATFLAWVTLRVATMN